MTKFNLFFLAFAALVFAANASYADVEFLPSNTSSVGGAKSSSTDQNANRCISEGYTLTSCKAGSHLVNKCSYHNSYYKNCCDDAYKFTEADCYKANLKPSRESCGGQYKCL